MQQSSFRTRAVFARRRPLAVTALALVSTGCVTSRRPLPQFDPARLEQPTTTVQVFDPAGQPASDRVAVGPEPRLVGRVRASPWSAAPAGTRQDDQTGGKGQGGTKAAAPAKPQEPIAAEDLYSRFGPNIIIHGDKRVTKTYYVDQETGKILDSLLALATGAPPTSDKPAKYEFGKDPKKPQSVLDSMLGGFRIEVQRIPEFDQQATFLLDPRKFQGTVEPGTAAVKNDLVLVTSSADGLEAFEQTMNLFYRSVPQILIEAKVVEIAWGDTLDVGVSPVDKDTPTLRTRGKGSFIKSLLSTFPNAAAATGTNAVASEGLLTIGGIHDNLELNAALELLQTRVKSDIVSHPKIAVRNGGLAVIDTVTQVPYPEAKIIGNNTQTNIKFAKVGVSMQIRPVVAPGETVVLQIYAAVDAITGFAETDPIPTPEISTRRAVTSVHVPSGKTTVIGGLITKTAFENQSQIPLLGDIPLLGYLFRSTFVQKGESEVVFMITPRIIYGFEGIDPLDEGYTAGGF